MLSAEFWVLTAQQLLTGVIALAPVWLTLLLAGILFYMWVYYRRMLTLAGKTYTLLEIKVPREVAKSPLAMEVVLGALHQTGGEGNWLDRYIKGKVRPWFSLELVSIEGSIHFFIWTDSFLKDIITSQIYSQYPSAEVYEVPDYTAAVPYGAPGSDWDLFGLEFTLTKPDAYPIKTYVDYGLDKAGSREEEEKVDPLTPVLESLGALGRGEQMWIQILIRATKGKKDPTLLFMPKRDWKEEAEAEVNKLLGREAETRKPEKEAGDDGKSFRTEPALTQYERDLATAIQRSISKYGFDTGIRGVYIARRDSYRPMNHAALAGSLKQFSAVEGQNGFRPKNATDFDYPWEEYVGFSSGLPMVSFAGQRVAPLKWKMFDAFRRRSYFLPPYQRDAFVLTTEELATLYHFPGGVAETPTFGRIESRKAEPPTDLPV